MFGRERTEYSFNVYYVSNTVQILLHLSYKITQSNSRNYPHFTNEQTNSQNCSSTRIRIKTQAFSNFKPHALITASSEEILKAGGTLFKQELIL